MAAFPRGLVEGILDRLGGIEAGPVCLWELLDAEDGPLLGQRHGLGESDLAAGVGLRDVLRSPRDLERLFHEGAPLACGGFGALVRNSEEVLGLLRLGDTPSPRLLEKLRRAVRLVAQPDSGVDHACYVILDAAGEPVSWSDDAPTELRRLITEQLPIRVPGRGLVTFLAGRLTHVVQMVGTPGRSVAVFLPRATPRIPGFLLLEPDHLEVCAALVDGLTPAETGELLGVDAGVVARRAAAACRLLGASNPADLAPVLAQYGRWSGHRSPAASAA